MGTRGLCGFRLHDQDKTTYNHYDSYPEGLGVDVVNFLRSYQGSVGDLRGEADRLCMVDESAKPTPEQAKQLKGFADRSVRDGSLEDWYVLLRGCQGNLAAYLESGFMIDSSGFALNSLFCEWGYIVNLDNETLEVYKGFNRNPNAPGRYAKGNGGNGEDNGIALIDTVPLADVCQWEDDDMMKRVEVWKQAHQFSF